MASLSLWLACMGVAMAAWSPGPGRARDFTCRPASNGFPSFFSHVFLLLLLLLGLETMDRGKLTAERARKSPRPLNKPTSNDAFISYSRTYSCQNQSCHPTFSQINIFMHDSFVDTIYYICWFFSSVLNLEKKSVHMNLLYEYNQIKSNPYVRRESL